MSDALDALHAAIDQAVDFNHGRENAPGALAALRERGFDVVPIRKGTVETVKALRDGVCTGRSRSSNHLVVGGRR